MSDPTLSFKGLMQYDPRQGWAKVDAEASEAQATALRPPLQKAEMGKAHDLSKVKIDNQDITRDDPLLAELFDQLHDPQSDDIAAHWKSIASRVNLLTEGMAHQRLLREQLRQLEVELNDLRRVILHDLNSVQRVAERQLVQAKLRAEVSHLAHQRLSAHLTKDPGAK